MDHRLIVKSIDYKQLVDDSWVCRITFQNDAVKAYTRRNFKELIKVIGDRYHSDSISCTSYFRPPPSVLEIKFCETERVGDSIVCHKCLQAWDENETASCMWEGVEPFNGKGDEPDELEQYKDISRRLYSALNNLGPYIDSIICYASTCEEWRPNQLAEDAFQALEAAKPLMEPSDDRSK